LTEESDAIAVVVSEETGGISICHRRKIERGFTPQTLRQRLGEILLQSPDEDEATAPEELAREVDLPSAREHPLVPDQQKRSDDAVTA
jgi:diadenylate cyclase